MVGSGPGAPVLRIRWIVRRFRSGPQSGFRDYVSRPRRLKPSVRFSRTRLSCWLRPTVCGPLESGALSTALSALMQSKLPNKACSTGLLHLFRPSEVLAVRYIPRRGSCEPMDAFILAPSPLHGLENLPTAGRLRSTDITSASALLHARPPPSRRSAPFPVLPVIGPTLLRRFLAGARRASPVARCVLVIVPSLPPRRSGSVVSIKFRPLMLPSPSGWGLGLRSTLSRPPVRSLTLWPDDSQPPFRRPCR